MDQDSDSVEWSRQHWHDAGQPDPDHFAAMAAVLRVNQVVSANIDQALRPHDLSRTAFLLLSTLLMSKEHTRPLGQLSKHLIVHPTTVTLVIDQLEKRELVVRRPHPSDRRTVLAALTPGGVELVTKAGESLAEVGYGLPGVSRQLAITTTEILRQVRERSGDR